MNISIIYKFIYLVEKSGSIIEWVSACATIFLGVITILLSNRANNINERLVHLEVSREKEKKMPILKLTDIDYDLLEEYHLKKGYLYYNLCSKQDGNQPQNKYNYFIRMEYTSLTDCLIEDIELTNVKFEKNGEDFYLSTQQTKENEGFILTKNESVYLYLLMSEEIYKKIMGGKFGSIMNTIFIRNIYGETYIDESNFKFSYICDYFPGSSEEISKIPFVETRSIKENNQLNNR